MRARAFTLVELLVAMGVVFVLVSLLIPTLGGARRTAQRQVCMAQIRDLAHSVVLYAADSGDHVPFVFAPVPGAWPSAWVGPGGQAIPSEWLSAAADFWVYPMLASYGGSFISDPLLYPLDNQTVEAAEWASNQIGVEPDRVWVPLARPLSRAFYIKPGSMMRDRAAPLSLGDHRVARLSDVVYPSGKALVFEEIDFHRPPVRSGTPDSARSVGLTVSAVDGSVAVRPRVCSARTVLFGMGIHPVAPGIEPDSWLDGHREADAFHFTRAGVQGRDWP